MLQLSFWKFNCQVYPFNCRFIAFDLYLLIMMHNEHNDIMLIGLPLFVFIHLFISTLFFNFQFSESYSTINLISRHFFVKAALKRCFIYWREQTTIQQEVNRKTQLAHHHHEKQSKKKVLYGLKVNVLTHLKKKVNSR